VADEAYRAVFLRVHPTGKMVLSLTTESDGREARYAELVAGELGVPPLDVKVVPADTDRFGTRPSCSQGWPSGRRPRR
jgi:CO/xanthine dehydrogenase Mo-binding subunit